MGKGVGRGVAIEVVSPFRAVPTARLMMGTARASDLTRADKLCCARLCPFYDSTSRLRQHQIFRDRALEQFAHVLEGPHRFALQIRAGGGTQDEQEKRMPGDLVDVAK